MGKHVDDDNQASTVVGAVASQTCVHSTDCLCSCNVLFTGPHIRMTPWHHRGDKSIAFVRSAKDSAQRQRVLTNKIKLPSVCVCVCVCVGPNMHLSQINKKFGSPWAVSLDTSNGSTPDIDTDARNTRRWLSTGAVQRLGWGHVKWSIGTCPVATLHYWSALRLVTGRRKVIHVHDMKACGGMEIQHHIFLVSTLDRVISFTFRPICHRGEIPGTHFRGGWVGPRDGPVILGRAKILGCVGNRTKFHRTYSK